MARKPMLPRISAGHILHPDYERELRAAEDVIRTAREWCAVLDNPGLDMPLKTTERLYQAVKRCNAATGRVTGRKP